MHDQEALGAAITGFRLARRQAFNTSEVIRAASGAFSPAHGMTVEASHNAQAGRWISASSARLRLEKTRRVAVVGDDGTRSSAQEWRILPEQASPEPVGNRRRSTSMTPLTVGALIAQLQRYPADLPVLIPGYESDWDPIGDLQCQTVCAQPQVPDPFSEATMACLWYQGWFRQAPQASDTIRAVLLVNTRRGTPC